MVKGSFVSLLFVKQLPYTEHKQQDAKGTAQKIGRDAGGEKGCQRGDEAAGKRTPQQCAPDNQMIARVRDQRGRRTAQKIEQIDAGGGQLRHVLHNGQP